MEKTVVGIFRAEGQAEKAVRALKDAGFSEKEVSVIERDKRGGQGGQNRGGGRGDMEVADQELGGGVAWGGAVGGAAGLLASVGALAIPGIGPIVAAGPLAATLTGAVGGGLAGGLVDWGIPQEEGKRIEEEVKRGATICLVKASDDKASKAESTLREHGAEVKTHEGQGRRQH